MGSKNFISQTNRTILFEEINPEKLDLLTLIGDCKNFDSLDDERIMEINKYLMVESFGDFLKKFEPKIYSYYDSYSGSVMYILEKPSGIPEDMITEIKIDSENSFLKMLITLLDSRKNQGNKNVDFKFENILELISPKRVMEDIKQSRKEIGYIYSLYSELDDNNPKKLELGDKLNLKFEEASKNYNNILGMLPLAMEDIKMRLLLENNGKGMETEKIKLGMLKIGNSGELEVIEYKQDDAKGLVLIEERKTTELVEAFREDYESMTENPNEYIRELVVRTFVPLAKGIVDINPEIEVNNYNNYLEFYRIAQENFIKVAKDLVEKLLGIKCFFDQYAVKIPLMKPKLIITNIKADMLIRGNNKDKLRAYFNTVNGKNDFEDMIWLGIYPNVDMNIKGENIKIRERFKGSKIEKNGDKNKLETLSSLMEVLGEYRVQLFFNFEGNDETTFDNMSTTGIDKYIDRTKVLENQKYSEFLIPVIPNFTIIPKDKSGVNLDYKMKYEEDNIVMSEKKEDLMKFWIEGVYVDGSYVAAGIIAATQCPNYLKERFSNVSNIYPGVRFDLELEDNSYYVKTTMSKEISGFTNSIKDRINQFNYGFVFSSDSAHINREYIKNIVVYKARTLGKNSDGNYEALYKTLTTTYIERTLRFMTADFKEDKLNLFFSTNPNSQKSLWIKDQRYINGIMQRGDDISHTIDSENNTCQLNIVFSGNIKNLQVEINKN